MYFGREGGRHQFASLSFHVEFHWLHFEAVNSLARLRHPQKHQGLLIPLHGMIPLGLTVASSTKAVSGSGWECMRDCCVGFGGHGEGRNKKMRLILPRRSRAIPERGEPISGRALGICRRIWPNSGARSRELATKPPPIHLADGRGGETHNNHNSSGMIRILCRR